MVELQQLCDKVPSFPSDLAFATICEELGVDDVSDVFSRITPEPVAAASLGQVYKATLKDGGDEVAVKVQRPFVLETVSLDLYLFRQVGLAARKLPAFFTDRLDIVALLDEFASRFYSELDSGREKGASMSLQLANLAMKCVKESVHSLKTQREMISRPKL